MLDNQVSSATKVTNKGLILIPILMLMLSVVGYGVTQLRISAMQDKYHYYKHFEGIDIVYDYINIINKTPDNYVKLKDKYRGTMSSELFNQHFPTDELTFGNKKHIKASAISGYKLDKDNYLYVLTLSEYADKFSQDAGRYINTIKLVIKNGVIVEERVL